jgi:replication factor A1
MDLLDDSGEIRATAFNDQCDKYYNMIEVHQVYYVTRGQLKTANKKFTSIDNEYEMSLSNDTVIEPCNDDVSDLPEVNFQFVTIANLEKRDKDSLVDVIGICKSNGDLQNLVSRTTNRDLKKRDFVLVDSSKKEITVTLWGTQAETFDSDASTSPVVALKGVRITDFAGCSLSLVSSSMMQVNPDIKEAHEVRGWWERTGSTESSESLSVRGAGGAGGTNWKLLGDIKNEQLGHGEKPDYFTCKAVVTFAKKDNCLYQACPTENCNKKVVDMSNGMYRCEKCAQEYPEFKWRMMLNINIADFSDHTFATCFQETGEQLLGITSEELGKMYEQRNESEEYDQVFLKATFKEFIFKLRTKMETYNDEARSKTQVVTLTPVDHTEYCKRLVSEIQRLSG